MENIRTADFTSAERRNNQDALLRSLPIFAAVCGAILVAEIVLFVLARPDSLALLNAEEFWYLNTDWNTGLMRWIYYLVAVSLAVSTVGITVNFKRLKREDDRLNIPLVSMWIFAALGLVLLLS